HSHPYLCSDSSHRPGSTHDCRTHDRSTDHTDPYGLSNPTPSNPGPPPQNPPSPYDSGTHSRPTYNTNPYSHPDQSFDSGYFQGSPHDSGSEHLSTPVTVPYRLPTPAPSNPGPPPPHPPPPYDSGTHSRPT